MWWFLTDCRDSRLGRCTAYLLRDRLCFSSHLQGLRPTTRDSYGRLVLGDVITSLNDQKVGNGSDLYKILDRCQVGDTVSLADENQRYMTDLRILLSWDYLNAARLTYYNAIVSL